MRDDTSQQQFEQHQEQEFHEECAVNIAWWEKNHELLRAFDELRPIITGEKDDKGRNLQSTRTPL